VGIIRKLGRKVKDGLRSVRDEAGHPGRPPPHKTSENPFWEEPGEKKAAQPAAKAAQPAAKAAPESGEAASSEGKDQSKDFWFLDGEDADGWEATNADGSE